MEKMYKTTSSTKLYSNFETTDYSEERTKGEGEEWDSYNYGTRVLACNVRSNLYCQSDLTTAPFVYLPTRALDPLCIQDVAN